LVYWCIALTYIGLNQTIEYPFGALYKAIPACLLAVWLMPVRFQNKCLLIGSLLFCGLGDILLALSFQHQFVFGLSAFLVAHLLFGLYFFRFCFWHKRKLPLIIGVLVIMFAAAMVILPDTEALFWPVAAYMLVIAGMAIMAMLAARDNPTLITGVLMFMVSDLLIGINRFVTAVPLQQVAIMLTYYAALYLMVKGIRRQFF
jgi:uncharacterized membrane protein YhhN